MGEGWGDRSRTNASQAELTSAAGKHSRESPMNRSFHVLLLIALAAAFVAASAGCRGRRSRRLDASPLPGSDSGIPVEDGRVVDPPPLGDGGVCTEGWSACDGRCVDLTSDAEHCGECFALCGADQTCSGGSCTGSTCPTGEQLCDGLCVDTLSDARHCGRCGNSCPFEVECAGGLCQDTCTGSGLMRCGGTCVDLYSNPAHCGACSRACPAGSTCAEGACQDPCVSRGLTSCSGTCVDLTSNPSHCGACGRGCGTSSLCMDGGCVTDCAAIELTSCGGSCVDLTTDTSHCGACYRSCASGETCSLGSCGGGTITGAERCGVAMVLPTTGGARSFTLSDATADHTLSCGAAALRPDRAFAWTPSASGTATFSARGIDTVLGVFSSSSCTATTALGCDDDGGGGTDSLLTLSVSAFATYWIVVASYSATPVSSMVTVQVTPP